MRTSVLREGVQNNEPMHAFQQQRRIVAVQVSEFHPAVERPTKNTTEEHLLLKINQRVYACGFYNKVSRTEGKSEGA
nr:unnamed protein product [Spirometra erinaceieuropaei]